ncbi:MAG: hypothetical protein WDM96_02710 [Lacunisphaera sp.]
MLPGDYRLLAGGSGWHAVEQKDIHIEASQTRELAPLTVQPSTRVTELEPYLVKDRADRLLIGEGVGAAPRRAAGNLDLPRTEDNALPFTVFTREQIARSGVVQLNEFFQRELLDGNTNTPPPEQDGSMDSFVTGSSNLGLARLRGRRNRRARQRPAPARDVHLLQQPWSRWARPTSTSSRWPSCNRWRCCPRPRPPSTAATPSVA